MNMSRGYFHRRPLKTRAARVLIFFSFVLAPYFLESAPLKYREEVLSSPALEGKSLGRSLEVLKSSKALRASSGMQGEEPSLPFSEIRALREGFTPSFRNIPAFGVGAGEIWIRLRLKNSLASSVRALLLVETHAIDELDFFRPGANKGEYVKIRAGQEIRQNKNIGFSRYPSFPIVLNAGQSSTFYFRLKDIGGVSFPLRLFDEKSLARHERERDMILGLFFGFMIIMTLYNLFLFFFTRENGYIYYVLYLSVLILTLANAIGLTDEYAWPGLSLRWKNLSTIMFVAATAGTACIFTYSFLSLRSTTHVFRRVFQALPLGWAALFVLTPLLPFHAAAKLMAGLTVLTIPLILAAGELSRRAGNSAARYFLLAWLALLLSWAAIVGRVFEILPAGFFTDYGIYMGASLEVLLLSLALADKINTFRKKREEAQKLLLEERERSIRETERTNRLFSRFVPVPFLDMIGKTDIREIKLGDAARRRRMILIIGVRGAGELAERQSPEESFESLNELYGECGSIIRRNEGFVVKYGADGLMALFPEKSNNALAAAIEIQRYARRFNAEKISLLRRSISLGIGLHSGELALGILGEKERMESAVISRDVFIAYEIEDLTREYGARIIISEGTLSAVADANIYKTRLLGKANIRGKLQSFKLIEIMDSDPPDELVRKLETQDAFREGVQSFFEGQGAISLKNFESVIARNPGDMAALHYLRQFAMSSARD